MCKIAVFASGTGTNTINLINYFKFNPESHIEVSLVVCNNPKAEVINKAKYCGVDVLVLYKRNDMQDLGAILRKRGISFIVLAGFLWKIPEELITEYPKAIVNIHPSLLPKYGGPTMYGDNVFRAVKDSGDSETGITIHYVDSGYDTGQIIYQKSEPIFVDDTIEYIKILTQRLEHEWYPKVIASLLFPKSCSDI